MGRIAGVAGLLALALGSAAPSAATTVQSVYGFSGGADGEQPYGQLAADKAGMLYGANITGGAGHGGTVFRFDPVGGTLTTLYSFTLGGAGGSGPASGVIIDGKGMLQGERAALMGMGQLLEPRQGLAPGRHQGLQIGMTCLYILSGDVLLPHRLLVHVQQVP